MRVALDTNILVSALISPAGNPAAIYSAWGDGKFTRGTRSIAERSRSSA
jgi:predicted nucleic acid-binding protein